MVGSVAFAATISGTVKSVGADGQSLVVTGADGTDKTMSVDAATSITVDGKAGKLSDVKAGNEANVTEEGGKASKVVVTTN